MKKISRLISLLCAAAISVTCLMPASAAEGEEYDPVNVALIASVSASSVTEGYGTENAIDADQGTYWMPITNKDESITLTWDTPMEIEYIRAIYSNGNHVGRADCTVSVSVDGQTFTEASTTDEAESSNPVIHKFTFDEVQTVKAIKFHIARTDKSQIHMLEFEAYSRVDKSILTPEIKQYKNQDGSEMFIATTVDKEAAAGKRMIATYTITRGDKTVTNFTEIHHAYKKIMLGDEEITSDAFAIENPGEYVTGIFITNIKAGDDISVTFALYGETYIFLGSSVTYGANANGRSFVELIDEKYDVDCVKLAVGGTPLSVGTTPNGTSYVERLVANAKLYPVCDHLNVQLSTNDATGGRPLGTVSASKNKEDFDTTTIAGAIEYIIAFAKETWDCEVSFYTNPKLIDPATGNENAVNWYYEDMVEILLEIKEKWGIRVLDMYNDEEMLAVSLEDRAKYMADSIHPNATGYEEWWLPKFEEFLFGEE